MTDWKAYAKEIRKRKDLWRDQCVKRGEAKRKSKSFEKRVMGKVHAAMGCVEKDRFYPYKERDAILRAIGFKSYREYLMSDMWKEIRQRVMEQDRWTCRICREKATEVHHKNYLYQTLTGQYIGGMMALCHECHTKAEFDGKQKNSLHYANRKIKQLGKKARRNRKHTPPRKPPSCL